MAYKLRPIMNSQYRVVIAGVADCYFTKVTGLSRQRETAEVPDGYSHDPIQVVGRIKGQPLVLTKPFDPSRDARLIDLFENWCEGDGTYNITITPLLICRNVEKAGLIITALGCKPVGLNYPSVDANANTTVSELELTFAPRTIKRA